jgi:hypothetical protein
MKLYVGMCRETGGRLLRVLRGPGGTVEYKLCWSNGGGNLAGLARALLAEHTGEATQAASLATDFARLMERRWRARFWTLREREIDEVIRLLERERDTRA